MLLGATADRPTLHVALETPAVEKPPVEPPALREPVVSLSVANATAHATCTALLADHAAFWHALISRPSGPWVEVAKLCETANVRPPAVMPRDLYATWIDHPEREQNLAAAVFVSLDSEWCVVVPTIKPDR